MNHFDDPKWRPETIEDIKGMAEEDDKEKIQSYRMQTINFHLLYKMDPISIFNVMLCGFGSNIILIFLLTSLALAIFPHSEKLKSN